VFFIEEPQRINQLQAIKDQIISLILGDPLEYRDIPPQLISKVQNLLGYQCSITKKQGYYICKERSR
jgi:hypothetical protein